MNNSDHTETLKYVYPSEHDGPVCGRCCVRWPCGAGWVGSQGARGVRTGVGTGGGTSTIGLSAGYGPNAALAWPPWYPGWGLPGYTWLGTRG